MVSVPCPIVLLGIGDDVDFFLSGVHFVSELFESVRHAIQIERFVGGFLVVEDAVKAVGIECHVADHDAVFGAEQDQGDGVAGVDAFGDGFDFFHGEIEACRGAVGVLHAE